MIERTHILESVPQGTLFLMPGHPGVYVDLPMNAEAASQFLEELSHDRNGHVNVKSPEMVVQLLIDKHGLVVVNKEDIEVPDKLVDFDLESHRFRISMGGLLDFENVKAYVQKGRIKPETGITVIDDSGHIVATKQARYIGPIRELFLDFEDEPDVAPYTIVTSSIKHVMSNMKRIVDQFSIRNADKISLTHRYGDDSANRVTTLGDLYA